MECPQLSPKTSLPLTITDSHILKLTGNSRAMELVFFKLPSVLVWSSESLVVMSDRVILLVVVELKMPCQLPQM